MSNANKKVTVGNLAALYQKLKEKFMPNQTPQELRAAMGLGDTLGALPVENVAITIVDDHEDYADYGAADGYVLSPLAVQELGMTNTGGTVSFGGIAQTTMTTSSGKYQSLSLTCGQVSSSKIDIGGTGEITILKSGMYRLRPSLSVSMYSLDCSTSGCTGVALFKVTLSPSTVSSIDIATALIPESGSSYYSESYSVEPAEVFLVAGTTIPAPTFGASMARYNAAGTYQSSGSGTTAVIAKDGFSFSLEIVRIAS